MLAWSCSCVVGVRIELKLACARRFGSLSGHFWLHLPGHFWPFGNLLDVRPFHSLIWSNWIVYRTTSGAKLHEAWIKERKPWGGTLKFARYRTSRLETLCSRSALLNYLPCHKRGAASKSPEQEQSLERALRPRSSPNASPKVCPSWRGCRLGQVLPVGLRLWTTSPQVLAWSCSCVVGVRIELKLARARRFGNLSDHFWQAILVLDVRPCHSLIWSNWIVHRTTCGAGPDRPPTQTLKFAWCRKSRLETLCSRSALFWIIYRTTSGAQLQKTRSRSQALKGPFGPDRPPTQALKFALVGVAAD